MLYRVYSGTHPFVLSSHRVQLALCRSDSSEHMPQRVILCHHLSPILAYLYSVRRNAQNSQPLRRCHLYKFKQITKLFITEQQIVKMIYEYNVYM